MLHFSCSTLMPLPQFSPTPTTQVYRQSIIVTISTITEGASIFYTFDGSMPSMTSIPYVGEIKLT